MSFLICGDLVNFTVDRQIKNRQIKVFQWTQRPLHSNACMRRQIKTPITFILNRQIIIGTIIGTSSLSLNYTEDLNSTYFYLHGNANMFLC